MGVFIINLQCFNKKLAKIPQINPIIDAIIYYNINFYRNSIINIFKIINVFFNINIKDSEMAEQIY